MVLCPERQDVPRPEATVSSWRYVGISSYGEGNLYNYAHSCGVPEDIAVPVLNNFEIRA